MPGNGQRSFTDDTFAEEPEWRGGERLRPRFGRARMAGSSGETGNGPKWEGAVLEEVLKLTELKQGWDSYNAPPIRWDAALFTLVVLRNIMGPETPIPQVVPSSVGGVQLEWHERSIDLELHITGPYECELWYRDHAEPNASPISEDVTNDFSLIQLLVNELTSRGAPAAYAVQH